MFRMACIGLGIAILGTGPVYAETLQTSLRPTARGTLVVSHVEEVVSRASGLGDSLRDTLLAPRRSTRPAIRPAALKPRSAAVAIAPVTTQSVSPAKAAAFARWIDGFRPRALSQGVSARTFDAAFRGVTFDPKVVERDSSQAEFAKGIWDYLDSAASDSRVNNGRSALAQHRALLDRIEAHYGVDKEVVLAVWGMETAYGSYRGSNHIIQSMASLAFDGRRRSFFETQLVAALQILEQGDTTPDRMTGSWAGAMGHTQFMPTSFQSLAVDFTGDGRRDIWGDDPSDALASTANYLKKNGWIAGQPWGAEVVLPRGFDYDQVNVERMPSAWARLGVMGTDGKPVPDYGAATILLPAGHKGAAFLVFKNFRVIKRYNAADAYAMGVGHLADRIMGGEKFQGSWPRDDRPLTSTERKELQTRLTQAGYDTQGVDGRIGPMTLQAIRGYQRRAGLVPDGYASMELLKKLR